MGVDHRGAHVPVPEEFLHGPDVMVVFGQVRLGQVVWGACRSWSSLLAGAAIIAVFPQIALWFPSIWVG